VLYADVGQVRMCAKRMARDILLVTAGGRRYGLTPADEAAFMAALSPMLPNR
jgi:Bacterial PH domain